MACIGWLETVNSWQAGSHISLSAVVRSDLISHNFLSIYTMERGNVVHIFRYLSWWQNSIQNWSCFTERELTAVFICLFFKSSLKYTFNHSYKYIHYQVYRRENASFRDARPRRVVDSYTSHFKPLGLNKTHKGYVFSTIRYS